VRPAAQHGKRFAAARILVTVTAFAAQRQDLGTVRFAWSPAWETFLAVRMFIDPRGRPYHKSWHSAVAGKAARLHLTPLFAVNPLRGSVPDFLTPPPHVPAPRFRDQLDEIRATPPEQVSEELRRCRRTLTGKAQTAVDKMLTDPAAARDVLASQLQAAWELLVAPFWPRIQAVLDADVAHRSRQLTDHGLRPMLEGIDARITWGDGTVIVNDGMDLRVELRGRGLVLMPSAYIWPTVAAVVDEPWQPTIVYPARGIAGLWQRAAPPPDALVRLLGRTRALLLARLDRPASTGALAALHGLSPSGTSRHLIAMRDAGLIVGTRHGHEIRYARTRLGTDLSRAAAAVEPTAPRAGHAPARPRRGREAQPGNSATR
jgi:DNA-binding transcriptional ArsR family regulator